MRTVTWHFGGLLHSGSHDLRDRRGGGAAFRLSQDYYPAEVRLYVDRVPLGSAVVVDINDDGVSIFDNRPQVDKDTNYKRHRTFKDLGREKIDKDSVLTMDVDQVGSSYPGSGLTVELDLEEA